MIFQEPMTSLNPTMTVGEQSPRCSASTGLGERAGAHEGHRDARPRRHPGAGAGRRLSACTFRRHAPAGHDRDGAGLRRRPPHRRRADDRPRRDVQAQILDLLRSCGANPARRCCSSRTTSASSREMADRVAVMYAGGSPRSAQTRALFARRSTPTRGAARGDCRTRAAAERAADAIPGACPPPARCPPAAASRRAAPTRSVVPPAGRELSRVAAGRALRRAGRLRWTRRRHSRGRHHARGRDLEGVRRRRTFGAATGARLRPSTTSPSRSAPARPSASSANRAAARARSRAWSPAAARDRGTDGARGPRRDGLVRARDAAPLPKTIQMVFQDPFSSLDPRLRVGEIVAEPLRAAGLGRVATPAPSGRDARASGCPPTPAALPARVQRRPAPAHRHRPGARDHPRSSSATRRLRPRRLGAGAGPEPPRRTSGASSACPGVHLARPRRRAARRRPRRRDVSRPHRRDRAGGRSVRAPRHPYTRTLLEAMPIAIPGRRRAVARPALASNSGTGCSSATRCPLARAECRASPPPLAVADDGRASACFRAMEVPPFVVGAERLAGPAELRLRRLQSRYLAAPAAGAGG